MSATLLIVDDEPAGRQALESVLTNQGYQLVFAGCGSEALEMAAELAPDVILLDVMMPGMDGYEVCRRLRADPGTAEAPVVMVTALDDRESRLEGIEAGADDFITKPIDRAELRARVRSITRLNRYRKLLDERASLEAAHQRLLAAYDATLESWSRALDLRDRETREHTFRVVDLTLRLGKAAGIGPDALVHVRRGAILHDIGKIFIPDQILHKPGPLDEQEWQVMRNHPRYAYDLLDPIAYLQPAIAIPHYHHERWDGTGYPYGLKGEEIPLAARVFAIVDVWDALLSDRPYRKGWPEDQARAYIASQAGQQFDPQLVPLFLELIGMEPGS